MLGCLLSLGAAERTPLSPTALVATADGQTLFVACATGPSLLEVATGTSEVRRAVPLPAPPTGLALSPDGRTLVVTCAAPQSSICLVDVARGEIASRLAAGHTAMAPVFSPTGRTLYVCNRFDDEVAIVDLTAAKTVARLAVVRQPVAAALTPDGRWLYVANHLPDSAANRANVAAVVSVIDTTTRKVASTVALPNGAGLVLGIAISPDGKFAVVTHNLAHHQLPTTQVERGWMNSAALSLIDVASQRVSATVLLDELESGAANPWAVAFAAGGAQLVVTHAGTHEVSLIDFPALLGRLDRTPRGRVATDLSFLLGLRHRVPLHGNGPRALAIAGGRAWAAGYFSNTIEAIELGDAKCPPVSLALGPKPTPTLARLGEQYFNDATYCFQHWQSCTSCHSWDARADGFNWDLLNDGLGNPKNAKSLLLAHRTPPAMSTGVRDNAETAVRAGFRHIQFAPPTEEIAGAVDAYLKSLTPVPSPRLENGRLSAAAQRGKRIFESTKAACLLCHTGPALTNLHAYDVGTAALTDPPGQRFDTPTLIEGWRTAPYLHDGSARTMREVLVERNRDDRHGRTSHLTNPQLDDLVAYLLSL